ncbi:hypothetical protein P154DRAFT_584282 [Amniculicola lignicola CBS 123094]|uniref:Cellulosomal protein n=1 Tax=Amniculicola lignicola CBS 123094 TaxID=1392246 RepID=A0A6A5X4M2_9PLEO|nr:hypothetical protein P154DRAFT_584282 [Amniculicola lignicola CBS 123094]
MEKQQLCNKFYDIDNLVTIKVSMPDADWSAVKNASPQGGTCNFGWKGDRYTWYKATSVTISGTKFPEPTTFSNVGIIKKSFCGSFSNSKPSLRFDYAQYDTANEKAIEKVIGVHNLVVNNCKQDDSYVRQPLGYDLCRQAGIPYMRCNFAKVVVNDVDMGVYVNLEPIKKRFIQNNFNGNDKGNAYELELGEDLVVSDIDSSRISFEGFSSYKDSKDLRLAATQIASGGIIGAKQVIDFDQYLKFSAMEALFKHWDGYALNRNNTYVYNDHVAVADPTIDDVNFKFIMSGIDQILQPGQEFHVGGNSKLGALVRADKDATASLYAAIRNLANTVFTRENHDGMIKPMIDRMEALLKTAGVTPGSKITEVRNQIRLVRTAAFQLIGEFPTNESRFMAKDTGNCFSASEEEFVTGSTSPQREVIHGQPTGVPADLWTMTPGTKEKSYKFQNNAYSSWLHCDKTIKTSRGNYDVYSFSGAATSNNDFAIQHDGVREWHASGYFRMQSVATGNFLHFSESDLTLKGKKQVYQGGATTLFLL